MPASTAMGFPAPDSAVKLLERLAYQVNVTIHSHHAEPIHDLRVATRRFQTALALFKGHFPARDLKKIKRRLKDLMDLSSEVRDFDIATKVLTKSGLPGAAPVKEKLAEQRKESLSQLVAALRRWASRNSSQKWRAVLAGGVNGNGRDAASRLPKMAKQFLAHGDDAAQKKASADDLHTYRIEAKKFRYALEIFQPAFGAAAKEWLNRLRKVQSLLGNVHDYQMMREVAADLGADAELEAWLKKRQRKKTREFRKLWQDEFSDAAARRQWVAALRRPARKPMARSVGNAHAAAAQPA
jgi:CHAD domain-containing protein